jgi:methanogenic corrinoid protein MtbC1
MLTASGFEVFDLGVDVSPEAFVSKAIEVGADIIAASALMTTTIHGQRLIVEELKYRGLRERFLVLVGGGPVTREWAEKIGADGYGRDAAEAVEVAKKLVAGRKQRGG